MKTSNIATNRQWKNDDHMEDTPVTYSPWWGTYADEDVGSAFGNLDSSTSVGIKAYQEHTASNVLVVYIDDSSNFPPHDTEYSDRISLPIHAGLRIESADEIEELVALFNILGLERTANRMIELIEIEQDLDDDESPIQFESAKQFASFIVKNRKLPEPLVAVCDDGCIQAEWHQADNRHLAIKFLNNGAARFSTVTPVNEQESGLSRNSISGTVVGEKLSTAVLEFIPPQ